MRSKEPNEEEEAEKKNRQISKCTPSNQCVGGVTIQKRCICIPLCPSHPFQSSIPSLTLSDPKMTARKVQQQHLNTYTNLLGNHFLAVYCANVVLQPKKEVKCVSRATHQRTNRKLVIKKNRPEKKKRSIGKHKPEKKTKMDEHFSIFMFCFCFEYFSFHFNYFLSNEP